MVTKLSALFRPSQPDWLKVELTPWQSQWPQGDFEFYKSAVLSRHILEFTYISAYSAARRRRVLPVRLVFKGRAWYLQGWRTDEKVWRTYRLSRVLDVADTGEVMDLPGRPRPRCSSFPHAAAVEKAVGVFAAKNSAGIVPRSFSSLLR